MSEDNVEIVRRLVGAFYARDTQVALSILDRDMTFESAFAEAKTYKGVGEFAQYRHDVDEALGKWRSEDDRFLCVNRARVLHLYRPHIVVRTDLRWPEQVFYGREAALGWYRGLSDSGGGDIRFEKMLDLGDRVLARVRWVFHGKLSDAEGEQLTSVIYTFRDGRVVLEEFFFEQEDALKAVGLKE